MTLEQRLVRAAHEIADGVRPPAVDPDAIRERARGRRRRRTAVAAAAVVTVVVAVGAAVAGRDAGPPDPVQPAPSPSRTPSPTPEPSPFPTAMTPEEVVRQPGALLSTVAMDPVDPDTRISVWSFSCSRPCPERGPHSFSALALTGDGYRTTTYVRAPFEPGVDLHVSSPRAGMFLVVDESNGGEWLVGGDGEVRPVTRTSRAVSPDDPRLWFRCAAHWRQTWCALDPATATAHRWPAPWNGSAARPDSGDLPWGANPEPRTTMTHARLEAWWYTEDGRRLRTLAAVTTGDYVIGTPPGQMAFWGPTGAETLTVFTSRDEGATWEEDARPATGVSGDPGNLQVTRAPSGTLFAHTVFPRLVVWRAEAGGGPFRQVYEQPGPGAETTGAGLGYHGALVHVNGFATAAVSEDDGLTWTTVRTWR